MSKFENYLRKLIGVDDDGTSPQKEMETMNFAEEALDTLYLDGKEFKIPETDKQKCVVMRDQTVYYPPKAFYGKNLTPAAFISMLRDYKLVPITVGNVHILTSWKEAKDEFGYSVLFKYLLETYRIIPIIEDEDVEDKSDH